MDAVVVGAEQLVEREAIAALRGGNQGGVIEVAGDALSVTNSTRASGDVDTRAPVEWLGSVGEGNLAETPPIRVLIGATPVLAELLEQDEHVSCRRRRCRKWPHR